MGAEMAEWKEGSAGRIGNTAELPDVPVGHFGPITKGRDGFGRPVRRDAWPMPHIGRRASPAGSTKSVSVAAMR
jgi:hypothetical protein